MNRDNLKHRLAEVESKIRAIAGVDIDHSDSWTSCLEKREKVGSLLDSRREILNEMFLPSDENVFRFKAVNERLFTLTRQLHDRVKALESRLPLVMDCQDFDDDHELEGTLRYCFNSEDSVLKLEDDCEYGSDFTLMIKLIADFGNGTVKENIECIHCSSTSLDDGQSWNEYPFSGRSEFADIIICYAVHQLTGHQLYSIPDLIRLNDFWAEAKLTIQSITRQDGTRFIPN